jgi:hypothetical protein
MNGNKTVNATFVAIIPGQQYTLTVNVVGNGVVTRNPDSATYPSGTVVMLTATPALYWMFWGWSGDLSGTRQSPISLTMDGNKSVTARFVKAGDFNGIGSVVLQDAVQFVQWYGMNSTDPNWNVVVPPWTAASAADFDGNGRIGLVDLVTLGYFYSLSNP